MKPELHLQPAPSTACLPASLTRSPHPLAPPACPHAHLCVQGRTAKTNFPIRDYDAEVAEYEAHLMHT